MKSPIHADGSQCVCEISSRFRLSFAEKLSFQFELLRCHEGVRSMRRHGKLSGENRRASDAAGWQASEQVWSEQTSTQHHLEPVEGMPDSENAFDSNLYRGRVDFLQRYQRLVLRYGNGRQGVLLHAAARVPHSQQYSNNSRYIEHLDRTCGTECRGQGLRACGDGRRRNGQRPAPIAVRSALERVMHFDERTY